MNEWKWSSMIDQPIGLHSDWLSSFLGVLVRELVPITIDNWKRVDKKRKEDLWECIKIRFKLDDIYKMLFTQVMGTRWREWKSRLVTSLRDASQLPDKESMYAILKPDNIKSPQEWNSFITKKLSKEFEAKSKKFRKIRKKNKAPHTMEKG